MDPKFNLLSSALYTHTFHGSHIQPLALYTHTFHGSHIQPLALYTHTFHGSHIQPLALYTPPSTDPTFNLLPSTPRPLWTPHSTSCHQRNKKTLNDDTSLNPDRTLQLSC